MCVRDHARDCVFSCRGVAALSYLSENKEKKTSDTPATVPATVAFSVAGKAQPFDIVQKGAF
jgi:hypothetical protein